MITLQDRRAEAIEAGWIAYADQVPGMRDAYLRTCEGWTVEAVCAGDEVIGALFSREGVIHLGIVPEWQRRWASRRIIRAMMERGTKTTVSPGDRLDFISRIGGIYGLGK